MANWNDHFIEDAWAEAKRLWTVRVALCSAAFWSAVGGLVMVWPGIAGAIPPAAYAVIGVILSVAFGVARFLKQPGADQ